MSVSTGIGFYISAITFLLGSSVIALFLGKKIRLVRWTTLLGGTFGSALALTAALEVLLQKRELMVEGWNITPYMKILLRMDHISAFFVLIISIIGFLTTIYGFGYTKKFIGKHRLDWMGALANSFLAMMILVVTADHFVTFLLAWESMSILSYFLVVTENESQTVQRSGYIYLVMTHIGTLFIILAFLLLSKWTGVSQISQLFAHKPVISTYQANLLFIFFLIGFGTKAGVFPLHVWLPRAHPIAPSHISALMSGVMIKTALYGILRFIIPLFSFGEVWWAWVIILFGVLSALFGVLFGVIDKDMKRYLAYSSSENMGLLWIMLGVSLWLYHSQEWGFATFAFITFLLHLLNHTVFKSLLFLGAGSIDYAVHTKNMNQLGGLIRRMPYTSIAVLVGGMAMAAVPPFNGFVSEWMMMKTFFYMMTNQLNSMVIVGLVLVGVLGFVGALSAAGMVNLFGSSFLGKPRTRQAEVAKEVPWSMKIPMVILAGMILFMGMGSKVIVDWLYSISSSLIGVTHPVIEKVGAGKSPLGQQSSISPLILGFVFLMVLSVVWVVVRLRFGKSKVQVSPTWGCGIELDSSMEYTATSFTYAILKIFKGITQPVQVYRTNGTRLHPRQIHYRVRVKSFLDMFMYRPVLHGLIWIASQFKKVQNGNIQTYLLLMFATLILFLMFVR